MENNSDDLKGQKLQSESSPPTSDFPKILVDILNTIEKQSNQIESTLEKVKETQEQIKHTQSMVAVGFVVLAVIVALTITGFIIGYLQVSITNYDTLVDKVNILMMQLHK
jgi:hypothetical protein